MRRYQVFIPTGEADEYIIEAETEEDAILKIEMQIEQGNAKRFARSYIEGDLPWALPLLQKKSKP